jgi:hypothetical protein
LWQDNGVAVNFNINIYGYPVILHYPLSLGATISSPTPSPLTLIIPLAWWRSLIVVEEGRVDESTV